MRLFPFYILQNTLLRNADCESRMSSRRFQPNANEWDEGVDDYNDDDDYDDDDVDDDGKLFWFEQNFRN